MQGMVRSVPLYDPFGSIYGPFRFVLWSVLFRIRFMIRSISYSFYDPFRFVFRSISYSFYDDPFRFVFIGPFRFSPFRPAFVWIGKTQSVTIDPIAYR